MIHHSVIIDFFIKLEFQCFKVDWLDCCCMVEFQCFQ